MSGQTGTAGGPLDSLGVSIMSDQGDLAIIIVVLGLCRFAQLNYPVLKFTNEIPY